MKVYRSTISKNGRVTIPADVRRRLGVGPADMIAWVITDGGAVQVRATRSALDSLLGSLEALPNESVSLNQEIESAVRESLARRETSTQKSRSQTGR